LNRAEVLIGLEIDLANVLPGLTSTPVDNKGGSYIASVGVGSPPTQYDLVIDTGSSNTWVGATTKYVKTSSSKKTSDSVTVNYGSGSFSGTEFIDTVTIGDGLVIKNQSIGVASKSTGFTGVDGILGIGPVGLTVSTLSPDSESTIPTVTDNLFSVGTIPSNLIGISFEPATAESVINGELTWGDVDSAKFNGDITFVPITSTSPANNYWGIDQTVTYGSSGTPILSTTAGIVDTGTTLLLIATDAFQRYKKATGATLDSKTGLLTFTSSQFAKLQSLFFQIGDSTFEYTPNAQIWPRSLNSVIGGTSGKIYSIVADLGSNSGQGLDFINGQSWLERFYSVYDTQNQQVGIATTPFTDATTN
jgi:cathepsin E